MNFITNPQLELAFDYIRNTNKNIFLTGKAGTGKTTFLHRIKEGAIKRMVVVAPTGVAAINAGGMTIHSFFQLPFGPQVPGSTNTESRQRRFSGIKINLIRSLDLVVIDEISMVRADILDGIDEVLRRYRDYTRPFGGVQLLMIGDLHQLPPVVKQEEWDLLRQHYPTPYFFSSIALQKTKPVTLELQHIFRQSDSRFIALLNKVRDNQMSADVLENLNSRYKPNFQAAEEDNFITLTSHNASANEINVRKLEHINEPSFVFKADIKGDFPEHSYPTEETLEFKKGAQVMFVKNDISTEKRFFNGKIGKITKIEEGLIYVECKDEESDISVSPVDWSNVKYTLDEKTKAVTEDIIGTFTQYPLKLAWAITIHKSQGLTFERAIIDAQAAFAHGQVYVALSRCKSFEGVVLSSRIAGSSVKTDSVVKNYTDEAIKNAPDEAQLAQSKREYQQSLMMELFSFKILKRQFDQLRRIFLEHNNTLTPAAFEQFKLLTAKARENIIDIAEKFLPQLQTYFSQAGMPEENEKLQLRIQKASTWFIEKLSNEILPEVKNMQVVTDNKAVRKTALENIDTLHKEVFIKIACFESCKTAFSVQNYIRSKTNAELDFMAAKKTFSPASDYVRVPKDTPHPELYAQFVQWRKEEADENGMELYEVLPTRSLLELSQFLPTNSIGLKKIKGIGEGKSSRWGVAIIGMIEKYCAAKQIPSDVLNLANPRKEKVKSNKPDTKVLSFDLYKAGKTITEIATERGFVRETIEGHLAHFIGKGELDIFKILEREKVEEIERFFNENETESSGEAKGHFGEKYSYGEIKMVVRYMKRKEEGGLYSIL